MSQRSCSSRSDGEARYSNLLNPCRDPNKNWEIDIAETLREYLNWLATESLSIQTGEVSVNFAEAALLIQGSTSVFSKKVEHLYTLAKQLNNQLLNEKASVSSSSSSQEQTEPSRRRDMNFAGRNIEFVALDDIRKCNNIDLNESIDTEDKKIERIPAVPLSLIPLDSIEKGDIIIYCGNGDVLGKKKDFRMNICTMHSSGCLLLPSVDYLSAMNGYDEDVYAETAPDDVGPMMVDDYDDYCASPSSEHGINGQGMNGHTVADDDGSGGLENRVEEPVAGANASNTSEAVASNGSVEGTLNGGTNGTPDHIPAVDDVGPSLRRRSVRQAEKAQKIEEEKNRKEQERIKKEEAEKNAWATAPEDVQDLKKQIQKKNVRKLPRKLNKRTATKPIEKDPKSALDFLNNIFHVEPKFLKRMSMGVNNLTVNTAFEQIFFERLKEQQELLQNCRKKLKLDHELELKEEPKDEELKDLENDNDLGTDVLPDDDDDGNDCDLLPLNDDIDQGDLNGANTNTDIETCASSSEDINNSYENLVSKHVDDFAQEVRANCQTTELYEKVSEWERRIKPILEQQNKKEVFEIHEYGSRVIDRFQDNNRKQTIAFEDICRGKPQWEICRYFLASLQLVNNSNIEITANRKPSGTDDIYLTLLSRKRHQEQLEEFGHNLGEHS